jgi:hypothetical protein
MLAITIRSHIICNKKGAIARVVGTIEIFEFEVWGWFKGWHLEAELKEKENN